MEKDYLVILLAVVFAAWFCLKLKDIFETFRVQKEPHSQINEASLSADEISSRLNDLMIQEHKERHKRMKKFKPSYHLISICDSCGNEFTFPKDMHEKITCKCGNLIFKPHFKWSSKENKAMLQPR